MVGLGKCLHCKTLLERIRELEYDLECCKEMQSHYVKESLKLETMFLAELDENNRLRKRFGVEND